MTDALARLPRTRRAIEEGIRARLHLGAQLYVSVHGEPQADGAVGENRPGEPLTADHLMLWLSSTKPVGAVALAQLWEQGRLELDDPVARHVPEFGVHGKERITLRHLLTHTAGIRLLDVGWPERSWEEVLARICAMRPEPRWVPGEKAGYHTASSWFVLGEVIRRLDGRPFDRYVQEEVFAPLGMADSWIGMPPERYQDYRHAGRIGAMWNTEGEEPKDHGWDTEERCVRPNPGGNGYGRHASARTFGHSGYRSSVGFADPERGLAVAVAFNGTPGNDAHERRIRATLDGVYQDLGLAVLSQEIP